MSRARSRIADLQESLAVTQLLDHYFHEGDGMKVLRLAASTAQACLPHGSNWINLTRESAGLGREASQFKKHFKVYAAGLHAREAWRQAGHENKGLHETVATGRRLTSV